MEYMKIDCEQVNSRGYKIKEKNKPKEKNYDFKVFDTAIEILTLLRPGKWVSSKKLTAICKRNNVYLSNVLDRLPLACSDKRGFYAWVNDETPEEVKEDL